MREKKERKRLNKKKLNNLTRYIQCVCLHLYVFGYVGCNEKEGSKREFLGKWRVKVRHSQVEFVLMSPWGHDLYKCFTNNSPSQHNSSRSLASSFSPLFQSRGSTLYGSLSVCVCVQFCSHCMCSLADPQEHCTRFVILTYPSDCSKDGSWFLAGFWIRSHIYKVTSTQLIFITKAHLKNKTQNAE